MLELVYLTKDMLGLRWKEVVEVMRVEDLRFAGEGTGGKEGNYGACLFGVPRRASSHLSCTYLHTLDFHITRLANLSLIVLNVSNHPTIAQQ